MYLLLPDGEDKQPDPSTSKWANWRKSSRANIALVKVEEDEEEASVGFQENSQEEVEMDFLWKLMVSDSTNWGMGVVGPRYPCFPIVTPLYSTHVASTNLGNKWIA